MSAGKDAWVWLTEWHSPCARRQFLPVILSARLHDVPVTRIIHTATEDD